ncbi:hypothetical protein [Planococcus beigongshangi]|uniref:hypothetical protein n=1 Tax=Planococcus beigongshangi TaxID=2782536 RepID=UPI00193B53B3|nr:hypothetical protein [Planococcus beigongshangi]
MKHDTLSNLKNLIECVLEEAFKIFAKTHSGGTSNDYKNELEQPGKKTTGIEIFGEHTRM